MSSFHDSLGVNQSGHVIAEKPQIKDGRKLKLKQTYVEGIFLSNWWLHFPLSEKNCHCKKNLLCKDSKKTGRFVCCSMAIQTSVWWKLIKQCAFTYMKEPKHRLLFIAGKLNESIILYLHLKFVSKVSKLEI